MPERILATYRIACGADAIAERAAAIAVEQSVEMPVAAIADARLRAEFVGRVETIAPAGDGAFRVAVSYSAQAVTAEAGQLLNVLFGNSSLHADVTLESAELPAALVAAFGGPRHGIAGLRLAAARGPGEALTCSALKPQGLAPDALGRLAAALALGGIDVVKDDHNLADQAHAPFAARVAACASAIAATGAPTLYAPHVSGPLPVLLAQARQARDAGLRAVLVCPMLVGLPAFQALRAALPELILMAHPALGGAARIAPAFLLGRLFRLLGADATVFPNHGGRFGYTPAACAALAAAARDTWHGLAAACPAPAGGMTPERVPEMLAFYGADTMLLIGGALLADPSGVTAAARGFVQQVRSCR